ncbi:solute carrier family 22 member 13-like [Lytechinus variegatus]|uniref:solute carrier family 22 member 13-like n=1 Tax=Lytechinus variegatus TaxID=7654 RepID=UPI001BB17D28|nr:solute carrier family 22 member 13-like [Lytechinus variegatus]
MAFDDLLPTLGEIGTYQKIITILLYVFKFPAAANVLAIVFIAAPADHWCSVSHWDTANCTELRLNESECAFFKKHLSIPHTIAHDDTITYDQCRKYDVAHVSFADAMTFYAENTNQSEVIYDVISCDEGWTYDRELSGLTITQSFDLVCDRKYLINLSQSLFFVGILIGSATFGGIADRFGRRVSLILCNVIIVISWVVSAFSPNFITFVVTRSVDAAACFGSAIISYVIATEFIGPSKRAFVSVILTTAFPAGYLLLTLYAYFINNWRYLLLALHLTFVLYFFVFIFVPESVRWQISKGRYKQAQETVRRVAEINKVKLEDDFFYKHNIYKSKETGTLEKTRDPNLSDLFRTPILRKRTIVLIIVWMANNLIFYGLHLSTGSFGVNIYLSFLISGIVEMTAMLLIMPMIEVIGRRYSIIACLAISGVASFVVIFTPIGAAKTSVAMVGKFGIACSWAVGLIYPIEVLPTVTRSVGVGICSSASRLVAIATPLVLLLYDVWSPGPLVLQTAAAMLAAGLCLILPETRGKKLPETLEDGETFGIKMREIFPSMEKLPAKV